MAKGASDVDRIMENIKDAFVIVNKDGESKISVQELGTLMRSVGLCPADANINAIGVEYGSSGSGKGGKLFDINDCKRIVQKHLHLRENKPNILECLNIFDKDGTRSVSAAELRHVLTNMGECLTDEEFDDFVRDLNIGGDGQIMCDDAAELLMSMM